MRTAAGHVILKKNGRLFCIRPGGAERRQAAPVGRARNKEWMNVKKKLFLRLTSLALALTLALGLSLIHI